MRALPLFLMLSHHRLVTHSWGRSNMSRSNKEGQLIANRKMHIQKITYLCHFKYINGLKTQFYLYFSMKMQCAPTDNNFLPLKLSFPH